MKKRLIAIFLITLIPAGLAVAFPWWWPVLLEQVPAINFFLEKHREIQTLAGVIQVVLFIATPFTFIIGFLLRKPKKNLTMAREATEGLQGDVTGADPYRQGDLLTGGIKIMNLDNLIISAAKLTDEGPQAPTATKTVNLLGVTLGILSKLEPAGQPVAFERLQECLNTEIDGKTRDAAVVKAIHDLAALGLVKTESPDGDDSRIDRIQLLSEGRKVFDYLLDDNEDATVLLRTAGSKTREETDFALNLAALKNAEMIYLSNLRKNLAKVFAGRQIINLQSEIVNPADEEIDTEIFMRRNRHRITLIIHEASSQEQRTLNVQDAAAEYDLLMILGDPGAGKTWTLGDIVLKHIDDYLAGHKASLPLFVRAAEWAPGKSPVEFLRDGLCKQLLQSGRAIPWNTRILLDRFDNDLASGRYVVMIDALNEMPRRQVSRGAVFQSEQKRFTLSRKQVESQAKAARDGVRGSIGDEREWQLSELVENMPDTRFVVTCRTLDYEPRPLPWTQARISSLNKSQIEEFVHSRLAAIDNAAQEMLVELERNSVAQSLAVNPFYLEIMVAVFNRNFITGSPQLLPPRRGELLGQLVSLRFRDSLQANIDEQAFHEVYKLNETVLSALALKMLTAGYAGARAPSLIAQAFDEDAITRAVQSGLIARSSEAGIGETIAFYHELIQEYYAAVGLANGLMRPSVKKLLRNQRWAEVIALWIELEGSPRKQKRLFNRVLRGLNQHGIWHHKPAMPLTVIFLQLFLTLLLPIILGALVVELMTEAGLLLRFFRSHPAIMVAAGLFLPFMLIRFWRALYFDFNVRRSAAHILSSMPYPETAGQTVDQMVGLLNKYNYVRNAPLIDALVKLGDFSRNRLQRLLYKGNSRARFAAAIALARIGDTKESKTMCAALVGDDYEPVNDNADGFYATAKMRWRQLRNLRKVLRDFLRSIVVSMYVQDVSHALAPHLLDLWRRTTDQFRRLIIFIRLVGIKGNLPRECAVELYEIVSGKPEDREQYIGAITLMGKIGDADSTRHIFELLASGSVPDQNKSQVIGQLINVRSEAAPVLFDYLQHPKIEIRRLAISLLGELGEDIPTQPEHLLPLLEDKEFEVQVTAVDTVGKLRVRAAKDALIKIITDTAPDEDDSAYDLYYRAVRALGDIGSPDTAKHISANIIKLADGRFSRDMYVNLILEMLRSLEKLTSTDVFPDIRLLLESEQDSQVLLSVLRLLVSIGDAEALELIDALPYQEEPVIRLQIIETLKNLGKATRRRASRLLESYLGDEDPDVKKAAQRALAHISPKAQANTILHTGLHRQTWLDRLTRKFLNALGLGPLDGMGQLWWSIIKQAANDQVTVQIKSSSLMAARHEVVGFIDQYMQWITQFAQYSADLATNRPTSVEQQIGKSIIFWIPIFLISVGVFYLFNLPNLIIQSFALSPAALYWGITTLCIALASLAETRDAARLWFLPLVAGLGIGIPIYARIFTAINFQTYWWIWIAAIATLIFILLFLIYKKGQIDGQRFQKQSERYEVLISWLLLFPFLPVISPCFFVVAMLGRLTVAYGKRWWMPVTAMVAAAWLVAKLVFALQLIDALPGWWVWIPFSASIAYLIAVEINLKLGSVVQALTAIAVVPLLPVFFVYLNELKGYAVTETGEWRPAGRFGLALWLALIPGEALYRKLYSLSLIVIPGQFWIIALIAVSALYFLALLLMRVNKTAGMILYLPSLLILLPLRLMGYGLKILLELLPWIVSPFIFLLRIIPLQITTILSDFLSDMPAGIALSTLVGIAVGSFFGFDLARRISQLIPTGILPYLLPLALLWLMVLVLAVYAYRQKNYVRFAIILFPLLLPLLPSILILSAITVSVVVMSFVLYSPDDEQMQDEDLNTDAET